MNRKRCISIGINGYLSYNIGTSRVQTMVESTRVIDLQHASNTLTQRQGFCKGNSKFRGKYRWQRKCINCLKEFKTFPYILCTIIVFKGRIERSNYFVILFFQQVSKQLSMSRTLHTYLLGVCSFYISDVFWNHRYCPFVVEDFILK